MDEDKVAKLIETVNHLHDELSYANFVIGMVLGSGWTPPEHCEKQLSEYIEKHVYGSQIKASDD